MTLCITVSSRFWEDGPHLFIRKWRKYGELNYNKRVQKNRIQSGQFHRIEKNAQKLERHQRGLATWGENNAPYTLHFPDRKLALLAEREILACKIYMT